MRATRENTGLGAFASRREAENARGGARGAMVCEYRIDIVIAACDPGIGGDESGEIGHAARRCRE